MRQMNALAAIVGILTLLKADGTGKTLALHRCEPWCTNPCEMMNGDVGYECGGCVEGRVDDYTRYKCRPDVEGFWEIAGKFTYDEHDREEEERTRRKEAFNIPDDTSKPPNMEDFEIIEVAGQKYRYFKNAGKDGDKETQRQCDYPHVHGSENINSNQPSGNTQNEIQKQCDFSSGTCELKENTNRDIPTSTKGFKQRHIVKSSRKKSKYSKYFKSCNLPIDNEAFKLEYCDFENGATRFAKSGIGIFRGAVPSHEKKAMAARVNSIPLPTRYLCGASDETRDTPNDCKITDREIAESFPGFVSSVDDIFEALGLPPHKFQGHHEFIFLSRHKITEIDGRPLQEILNEMQEKDPTLTDIGAQWELTERHNLPVFDAYHDWHVDNYGNQDWHAWVLVQRNATDPKGNAEHETGIVVIPADAYDEYGPIPEELGKSCRDRIYNQLGCTIQVYEGDLVLYRVDLPHRTQDRINNRIAMTLELVKRQ
mmetsp:Transcript_26078/g.62829  ORF Transcript_26078/g.62829 Transcript_26078/m.62829 type:complete len:483 (+) Transcript_26078:169-1617(+)